MYIFFLKVDYPALKTVLLLTIMDFVLWDLGLLIIPQPSGEVVWGHECPGPGLLHYEPGPAVISFRTSHNFHCEDKLQYYHLIRQQISS